MSRNRAPVAGGYTRRTLSLPADLYRRIKAHLDVTPGLTMSAFMTDVAEARISKLEKRKEKR